jgi:hypothetical protein
MKSYIVNLTECVSDQVITDLDCFGVKIVWASQFVDGLIAIETDKSKEELEEFFLIDTVTEEPIGTYNV